MKQEPRTVHALLADNLKDLIAYQRITRTELGERLDTLGFSNLAHAKVLRRILDGQRRVDVDELAALALALEIDITALLSSAAIEPVRNRRMAQGLVHIGISSLPAFAYDVSILEPGEGRVKSRARTVDWDRSSSSEVVWDIESDRPDEIKWLVEIAAQYDHLLPVSIDELPGLALSEQREIGMILQGIRSMEEGPDVPK